METEDTQPNKSTQEKFKSYYVVWKQFQKNKIFKSPITV